LKTNVSRLSFGALCCFFSLVKPRQPGLKTAIHLVWSFSKVASSTGASRTIGPGPYNACRTFGIIEFFSLRNDPTLGTISVPQRPSWCRIGGDTQSSDPSWGAYYEPSRLTRTEGRLHVTGGLAVRIPLVRDWRLGVSFDWAEDYLNAGLGFGFWY